MGAAQDPLIRILLQIKQPAFIEPLTTGVQLRTQLRTTVGTLTLIMVISTTIISIMTTTVGL